MAKKLKRKARNRKLVSLDAKLWLFDVMEQEKPHWIGMGKPKDHAYVHAVEIYNEVFAFNTSRIRPK